MTELKKYWLKVTRFEYEYYIHKGQKIFTGAYREICKTGIAFIHHLTIIEGDLEPTH